MRIVRTTSDRRDDNSVQSADLVLVFNLKIFNLAFCNQFRPPGDGRHYRNTITVLDRRGVLLQIADVLVIEVDIHKGTQFAFVGIKMAAQLRMLRHEVRQRVADGASLHINRRQLAGILAQGGRDVDLGHRLYMMPQEGPEIHGLCGADRSVRTTRNQATSIFSPTSFLSFSSMPVSSNELVSTALPFSTLVIT